MAKKKTLKVYAKETANRHHLAGDQLKLFHLYAGSVGSRLKEVQFALSEINDLYYGEAIFDTAKELGPNEQMFYQCSVFCAVAYSVFDVLANAANAVHRVHANERDVSFKNIEDPTWTHASVLADAQRIRSRPYFERLDKQRNCALHRRSLYVQRRVIQEPDAYSPVDSTVVSAERYSWILADDPDEAVNPKTAQNHEVLTEFGNVKRWLQADAIAFMRVI